jgi:transcriptional regulator with XRE-family HTH domain
VAEETFAGWLREQRKAKGLTLRELAGQLGVKHPYLSQLENQLATPSEDLARRIAQAFGADEEKVLFLARDVRGQIMEIKEKYPREAPAYFRRVAGGNDKQ